MRNLITADGYMNAARAIAGESGAGINRVAVGTSSAPPNTTDTAITGAVYVPISSIEYATGITTEYSPPVSLYEYIQSPAGGYGVATVGTRFRAIKSGRITKVRFFRNINETATSRLVRIWTPAGDSVLASATTVDEPLASTWIEVSLASPLSVSAGSEYVVSADFANHYHALNSANMTAQTGLEFVQAQRLVGSNGFPLNPTSQQTLVDVIFEAIVGDVSYTAVKFNFTVDFLDAVGMNIYEFGLITQDDKLFSRLTRALIAKTNEMQLVGQWTINL